MRSSTKSDKPSLSESMTRSAGVTSIGTTARRFTCGSASAAFCACRTERAVVAASANGRAGTAAATGTALGAAACTRGGTRSAANSANTVTNATACTNDHGERSPEPAPTATAIDNANNTPANNSNHEANCPPNRSNCHHELPDAECATPDTRAVPNSEYSIVVRVNADPAPESGTRNVVDRRAGTPSAVTHNSPEPVRPSTARPDAAAKAAAFRANEYFVVDWPPNDSSPANTTSRAAPR